MFTHKELVDIAYKWILTNTPCGVAFKELITASYENPDAIGFCSNGITILIECKTSRSDYLADSKKVFRKDPALGVGSHRFYLCPKDLIKPDEIPQGWGLIYVNEKGKARAVKSNYVGNCDLHKTAFEKNLQNEYCLMYSALRRLHINGVMDKIYNFGCIESIITDEFCD